MKQNVLRLKVDDVLSWFFVYAYDFTYVLWNDKFEGGESLDFGVNKTFVIDHERMAN